jgi:hypothetical protein
MNEAPLPVSADEITLPDIWIKLEKWSNFLWSRKVWIIGISFLFSLGGYFIIKFKEPKYAATLTFALEQESTSSGLLALASQFGMSLGSDGGGLSGENLLALMKSRRIIEEVLLSPVLVNGDTTRLINQYVRTCPELKESWDSLGIQPITCLSCYNKQQDSAMGAIIHEITEETLGVSKIDEQQSFVTVSYNGHDEIFAGRFVELLTQKAIEFYIHSKMANSHANIAKLEKRVDSVSAELQAAMFGYASAQDQNTFTVQSAAKVPSLQKQIKVTMLTTLYGELVKNLELSKTIAAREEPIITIIDRPHYPLRVHVSKLKSAVLGGVIGGFLTVLFFVGQVFFNDLNKQVDEQKKGR